MTNPRIIAALVVATAVGLLAASSAAAGARGIPSNPCALKIAPQLKALGLSGSCRYVKPTAGQLGRVSSGTWGRQPHVLGIGFFDFGSSAHRSLFKKSFFTIGDARRVGPDEVEAVGPSGVSFAGIVKGVGINLSVNEASASSAAKARDAKIVLKLVKALSAQL